MKKNFLAMILAIGCVVFSNAQDLLVKKNAEEVKVKVLEVNSNEVKYKLTNNLEGPTYTIDKNKIFYIKYQNGQKDIFSTNNSNSNNIKPTGFLSVMGRKYYMDDKKISRTEFLEKLKTNPTAYNQFSRAERGAKMGLPIVLISGLVAGAITYSAIDGGDEYGNNDDSKKLYKLGGGVVAAGLTTLVGGLILNAIQGSKREKAIAIYNSSLSHKRITYSLNFNGNGIGLAINF